MWISSHDYTNSSFACRAAPIRSLESKTFSAVSVPKTRSAGSKANLLHLGGLISENMLGHKLVLSKAGNTHERDLYLPVSRCYPRQHPVSPASVGTWFT